MGYKKSVNRFFGLRRCQHIRPARDCAHNLGLCCTLRDRGEGILSPAKHAPDEYEYPLFDAAYYTLEILIMSWA
jgi:hypothetical protein